jgi:cytoskeletal protein RodZ
MGRLRDLRIGWRALALLVLISAAATLVVLRGNGRTPAQQEALTELAAARHVEVVQPAAAGSSQAAGDAATAGDSTASTADTSNSDAADDDSAPASDDTANAAAPASTPDTSTAAKPTATTAAPDAGLPKVKHVFLVTLSTPSYAAVFGKGSQATYLHSLLARGMLLTNFHALAGSSELADELAMISGQAPNADTVAGCPTMSSFAANANVNAAGLASGKGCVYPDAVTSIASEADLLGDSWGAYIDDQGESCEYVNSGQSQLAQISGTDPGYDSLHNPFIYFTSLVEGDCASSDQDLSALPKAIAHKALAPNFVYVAPDACADGDPSLQAVSSSTTTDTTTTSTGTGTTGTEASTLSTTSTNGTTTTPVVNEQCPAGSTSGVAAEDAFLQTWVPKILKSAAYRDHGVLVIAFAGAGTHSAATRTGALVISSHTKRGRRIKTSYGPYSLLRSLSDMLDLDSEGHALKAPSFAKRVL